MRLLLLATEFPPGPGGIGMHAYQLATQLSARGWEVSVITAQDYASPSEIGEFNDALPFRVECFAREQSQLGRAVSRMRTVARRVRSWRPDLVIASGQRAVWLGACLSRSTGIPMIAVGHGTEFGSRSRWTRQLTRWSFEQAGAVVCVSNYTRDQMLLMGIRPHADYVIPNGADESHFVTLDHSAIADFRRCRGLSNERVLLTIGNVTERKGQETVIRALPRIIERVPDVVYVMAGLPTLESELTLLARGLGVARHVRFAGRVDGDELVRYVNACDVFLMTSRRTEEGDVEGYGIAVVEAALCCKPAVVTTSSGLVEAIVHGDTGIAVPENDAAATARAVLALLENEQKRREMGAAARQRAIREQTWTQRIELYHQLIGRVLAAGDVFGAA